MTTVAFTPSSVAGWDTLDHGKFADETATVRGLLDRTPLDTAERAAVLASATDLVERARRSVKKQGVVESFLQEFSLGTREGLALMCLAEALLRTPDEETRDRLIAEKIGSADWASHLGQSDSLFVNASTWGLMLTGKLVDVDDEAKTDLPGFLKRIVGRLGEPVIREAVAAAVRIMGEQFVVGRTIEAALKRSNKRRLALLVRHAGRGRPHRRMTPSATRRSTPTPSRPWARPPRGRDRSVGHGVSVKLSALSPRYEAVHEDRVWSELYPRVKRLALIAAKYDINFTMDAEEADRLALSLKLLDSARQRGRARRMEGPRPGRSGLSEALPRSDPPRRRTGEDVSGRRLMVRLVKGAYWDTEIKRAQQFGRHRLSGLHHQGRDRPELPRLRPR